MLSGLLFPFLALDTTTKIIMIVVWTIIVIGAIIIEAETAELVSCWFGVAGLVCLILAFCNVGLTIQLIVFAVLSIVLILATRPFFNKFNVTEDIPTNVDRIKGMTAVVTKPILKGEKGEVKVNYQIWTAICKKDIDLLENTKVIVKEIEGNKLIVDEIENIEVK